MELQRRGADEMTDDDDMGSSEDGPNDFGCAADCEVCFIRGALSKGKLRQ